MHHLANPLDTSATAMKQGATRIKRGRECFRLAAEVARRNGWPFHWRLVEVEGVGHGSSKMFASEKAAVALRK